MKRIAYKYKSDGSLTIGVFLSNNKETKWHLIKEVKGKVWRDKDGMLYEIDDTGNIKKENTQQSLL